MKNKIYPDDGTSKKVGMHCEVSSRRNDMGTFIACNTVYPVKLSVTQTKELITQLQAIVKDAES